VDQIPNPMCNRTVDGVFFFFFNYGNSGGACLFNVIDSPHARCGLEFERLRSSLIGLLQTKLQYEKPNLIQSLYYNMLIPTVIGTKEFLDKSIQFMSRF